MEHLCEWGAVYIVWYTIIYVALLGYIQHSKMRISLCAVIYTYIYVRNTLKLYEFNITDILQTTE